MPKTSKTVQPVAGRGALLALLGAHPFHAYFEYVARARFPGKPASRVRRAARELPHLYWTCVTLDLAVRALGLGALVAVVWARTGAA